MFLCDAGFLEKKPNALGITGKELVINLAQSSISLLNRHLETARPLQISPLMSWFALRCQQCSDIVYFDPNSEERRALETRLCPYLQNLEDEMESLQRSVNMRPARAENHRMDPACNRFVQPSDFGRVGSATGKLHHCYSEAYSCYFHFSITARVHTCRQRGIRCSVRGDGHLHSD